MAIELDQPHSLAYYGAIQGATQRGEDTAGIWQAVRDVQASFGADVGLPGFQDVNRMRNAAGLENRAIDNLSRTPGNIALDSQFISTAPWSRPQGEQNSLGIWQARIEHQTMVDGRLQTDWRTVQFTGGLPATVQDLRDAIDQDAQAMADQYGVEHVGVLSISLQAI